MAKAVLMRPQLAAISTCRFHFLSSRAAVPCLRGTTRTYCQLVSPKLLPGCQFHAHLVSGKTRWESGLLMGRRRFCNRAMNQVNDPGSIDTSLMQSMQNKIKEQLNAESVIVTDMQGDGRHVSIHVISSAFEGQSAVNRQRMVYKAIWEELQHTVHAVDEMTTRTPSEVAGKG